MYGEDEKISEESEEQPHDAGKGGGDDGQVNESESKEDEGEDVA